MPVVMCFVIREVAHHAELTFQFLVTVARSSRESPANSLQDLNLLVRIYAVNFLIVWHTNAKTNVTKDSVILVLSWLLSPAFVVKWSRLPRVEARGRSVARSVGRSSTVASTNVNGDATKVHAHPVQEILNVSDSVLVVTTQ